MEIKEVENLLSVSRSNIRFYEKEGLINPERGKNNYRNYSRSDVAMLKKIIVLRKLGFTVEEISGMQKGELLLADAVKKDIARLEDEIETLQSALKTAKDLSVENPTFENMDEERYWNTITGAENDGEKFVDICMDCLYFELDNFDRMWKYVFFYDFKKSRKKFGALKASGILLLICIARGLSRAIFWRESFWDGFLYPAFIFLIASLILVPLFILCKKRPKTASVIATVLMVLGVLFLAFIVFLIIYGIIYNLIH